MMTRLIRTSLPIDVLLSVCFVTLKLLVAGGRCIALLAVAEGLYFANLKLNHILRIGDKPPYVERWNDDLQIAGSSPLYATTFIPTMFALWYTSLLMETHS